MASSARASARSSSVSGVWGSTPLGAARVGAVRTSGLGALREVDAVGAVARYLDEGINVRLSPAPGVRKHVQDRRLRHGSTVQPSWRPVDKTSRGHANRTRLRPYR